MKDLCARCDVCAFLPPQLEERWFSKGEGIVLVVDDCQGKPDWEIGMKWSGELLGNVPFEYTSTVRCDYNQANLSDEQNQEAVDKCGVWTNLLLERRAVILTTETGLQQMKIGDGKRNGSVFRSTMLGIIVVLPALCQFDKGLFKHYKPLVERALKEVRLV